MQFATKNEERLAIDDELCGGTAFLEMWRTCCLGEEIGMIEADENDEDRQYATRDSHVDRENSMRHSLPEEWMRSGTPVDLLAFVLPTLDFVKDGDPGFCHLDLAPRSLLLQVLFEFLSNHCLAGTVGAGCVVENAASMNLTMR